MTLETQMILKQLFSIFKVSGQPSTLHVSSATKSRYYRKWTSPSGSMQCKSMNIASSPDAFCVKGALKSLCNGMIMDNGGVAYC